MDPAMKTQIMEFMPDVLFISPSNARSRRGMRYLEDCGNAERIWRQGKIGRAAVTDVVTDECDVIHILVQRRNI